MNYAKRSRGLGRALLLLSFVLLTALLVPGVALAKDTETVVRVGWYESPFNTTDELGRRSGYAYDYQQKIAAYTGWTYEYVEGSWSELLTMLEDGYIDLLTDVSYTDERAQRMLFSELPMGAEEYFLYAAPDNQEIVPEDYATLEGKKVGANKGSVQIELFRAWAQEHGIQAEIVELSGSEEANLAALKRGNIDLYLSIDGFIDADTAVPVCQVGSSDFYFGVSATRPEFLNQLNAAMVRVQEENPQYNQQLYAKYLSSSNLGEYLSAAEASWVEDHGVIRVGYQDNYLAFCAQDPETGELTGALKDYLAKASDCMANAHIDFEPICYPSSAEAMEALQAGDVDCVFPANLTSYDGETLGVFVTPALMCTDMAAVVREAEKDDFGKKERVTVAVNADNPNYDIFLKDHFPEWRAIYFANTQECLKAVADGHADCLLISDYRYNNISELCEKYNLTTWSTGVEMDYCFAVNRDDTMLYSILAKVANVVPQSTVNAALTYYYTEDARGDGGNELGQRIIDFALGAVTVVAFIGLCLLFGTRMRKRYEKYRSPIPTKEDFALLDDVPISYSVYHVMHLEHSTLYDAQIVYVNHKFEELGGHSAESVVGHHVRELYPYVEEEWFSRAKRAALDGEVVEHDYVDPLSGKTFHYTVQQVYAPGYCAVTYQEA